MHLLVVVLHVEILGIYEQLLDARLTEVFDERIVFWQSLVCAEEYLSTLFLVTCSNESLCLIEQLGNIGTLLGIKSLHKRLELHKLLVLTLWNRT